MPRAIVDEGVFVAAAFVIHTVSHYFSRCFSTTSRDKKHAPLVCFVMSLVLCWACSSSEQRRESEKLLLSTGDGLS